jgi:hypothetical protein
VREKVETGRLAGAIGTDQRMDAAAADGQVHVLDRDESLELLGQAPRFENRIVGHFWNLQPYAPRARVNGAASPVVGGDYEGATQIRATGTCIGARAFQYSMRAK